MAKPTVSLSETLKQLEGIASWFDEQQQIDVEEGLKKVKEAASLFKAGKDRLKQIENEFEEVKKEIDGELVVERNLAVPEPDQEILPNDKVEAEDIPF